VPVAPPGGGAEATATWEHDGTSARARRAAPDPGGGTRYQALAAVIAGRRLRWFPAAGAARDCWLREKRWAAADWEEGGRDLGLSSGQTERRRRGI
jgi:hypothetical protein